MFIKYEAEVSSRVGGGGSGRLTHISGHPSAAGRAQDRESSPVRDRRSTTVLRHQLSYNATYSFSHNCQTAGVHENKTICRPSNIKV